MNPTTLALITTTAPFVAFFISLVFLFKQTNAARAVVLLGGAASLVGSLLLLAAGPQDPIRVLWFTSGEMNLQFGFLLDGISLSFGAVVALITFCVQVYSLGYMADDPGKVRFFSLLGLFGWAMLSFVYAIDLLQAFIFWELVGLASFFLIGFWYEKPSAVAAAKKAFVMTRIGDVGLFIGILMILNATATFDIPALLDSSTGLVALVTPKTLTVIMLLIFFGIMGKSAQFPLHTWLPDAMEGPTPVSALLHSATMVAAGVYLFARLHPLFLASETVVLVVLSIAVFTTILSSTVAMVEEDIKKVLAYSSISQLGYMIAGLATGSLFAGVFHLITHAFFKALLFLTAGSYIHHTGSNLMREIGAHGGKKMRWTSIFFVIGSLALAGIPPLAGFFSKEAIIGALGHHGHTVFQIGTLFAAMLTAYYTFRMLFLVLLPHGEPVEVSHDDHHHGHGSDSPLNMLAPMGVLACLALVAGFGGGALGHFLGTEEIHHSLLSMVPALSLVALGIALAWYDFGRSKATCRGFIGLMKPLDTLFKNKWYIDAFYAATVARLIDVSARILHGVEVKGFDAGFDAAGETVVDSGPLVARSSNGVVQFYIGTTIVMVVVAVFYIGMH